MIDRSMRKRGFVYFDPHPFDDLSLLFSLLHNRRSTDKKGINLLSRKEGERADTAFDLVATGSELIQKSFQPAPARVFSVYRVG